MARPPCDDWMFKPVNLTWFMESLGLTLRCCYGADTEPQPQSALGGNGGCGLL